MWLRVLLWMLVCTLPGMVRAEPNIGLVTIIDGEVFVIRDGARFSAAEGVRIVADDIVESAAQARLARVEFSDGFVLDIGPATRVLMTPKFSGERGGARSARLYLLRGWAKITAPPQGKGAESASFAGELFDVTGITRDVVLNVEPTLSALFAESGDVVVVERSKGKALTPQKLKAGEYFTRSPDAKGVLAPRPAADFIQRVPRPFVDTLPLRTALFAAHDVPAKRLAPIAYADVQAWIDAGPALRPLFVARWKAFAQSPDFRKGLAANMRAHPEWDRILYPEKYLPKLPASAASSSQ